MRNACRPMGRFFCLLMVVAAMLSVSLVHAQTNSPTMTQVVDTVYRADGTAAGGVALISWPAFTTADGKAVAAGSLSVQLGNGGAFAASLAPNTGAQPAGVYYKVVFQLASQEPSTEYWVVPATGSTSIGAVRAKLMPATIAAQVLTRDVADTNYVHVAGDQTVSGVKTFSSPPTVPTPQNGGDAANKGYVDSAAANVNLASPGPIGAGTPNAGTFTALAGDAIQAQLYPWADITNPAYGAKGDAQLSTNCATTIGSATLTCTGGNFVVADVGKAVCASAAGAVGAAFCSTISGYTSASVVTMAASARNSAAGQSVYWGTNNDAAFAAAIAAAQAAGVEIVFVPTGKFLTVNGASVVNNGTGNTQVPVRFYGTCPKRGGRAGAGTANLQCSTIVNGNNNTDAILFTNTTRSGIEGIAVEGFGTGVLVHFTQGLSGTNQAAVTNSSGIGKTNFVVVDGFCGHLLLADNSATSQTSDTVQVNTSASSQCNEVVVERNWFTASGRHGVFINPNGGSVANVSIRDNQIDLLQNGDGINANFSAGVIENNDFESITGTAHYGINAGGYAIQFGPNFFYNNKRNFVANVCYYCQIANQSVANGTSTDTGQPAVWVNGGSNNLVLPPNTMLPSAIADGGVNDTTFYPNGTAGFPGGIQVRGSTVIDSLGNATVQNLTVNGTCTGCGGSTGNLASPPAIGNVAPNAGTFTTLASQVVNGIPNAARFSGADACAKINAAIASLDARWAGRWRRAGLWRTIWRRLA
jgi:hypothetical protein